MTFLSDSAAARARKFRRRFADADGRRDPPRASPVQDDPTGCDDLRREFEDELRQRWRRLDRVLERAVVASDCLGLGPHAPLAPLPSEDKVKSFRGWLDELVDHLIVGDGKWMARYLDGAHEQGEARAERLAGRKLEDAMPDIRKFLLIRHGATKLNNGDSSADRLRGWLDVPLSREGIEEAVKLSQQLKAMTVDDPLDIIVTSDLDRAVQTALIISDGLDLTPAVPIEVIKGLRPWDVGIYAGEPTFESLPKLRQHVEQWPDEKVPDGESFNSFKTRAFHALFSVLDAHRDERIAVVTHHRFERLMKAWQKKGCPADLSIDLLEFMTRGEATGSVEEIEIVCPPQRK